ncbi:MAG: hypothetical protein IJJ33_01755 [Victivallales bacterium]|nr:hypothetical protein [Victivallales bacterium]
MPEVKSKQEHAEYVERLVRVSFFFARRWLAPRFPDTSIGELLREHTPALFHGLGYRPEEWRAHPECLDILGRADRLASLEPTEFECALWEEISLLARRRAEMTYPDSVGVRPPDAWNCGSLKYDAPNGCGESAAGRVVFHIANAIAPRSILDEPEYLARCFLLLMRETELRFGARELFTSTWLNEHPGFLALFPAEWHGNMQDRATVDPALPRWHFGWWGQLVTGRGTVNPAAERFVRETGCLKYACLASHCSFVCMRRHLKENFSV